MALILASGSPRRKELMALVDPDFWVEVSAVEEDGITADTPAQLVEKLAVAKTRAVAALHPQDTVLGFDTVVDCGGTVFGKPHDQAAALAMLRALSGQKHLVHTGVCVCRGAHIVTAVETSAVFFAPIPDSALQAYVQTPEPYDKAGGYAIQGWAARWCSRIEGCYYNIMGLPVYRTVQLLAHIANA